MFKMYVGALDGAKLLKENVEDINELYKLYEEFSKEHEIVTCALLDDNGNNLTETLAKHKYNNKNRLAE